MISVPTPFGSIGGGDIAGGIGAATSLAGGFIAASGAEQAGAAQAAAYRANAFNAGLGAAQAWQALGRQQQGADYKVNRIVGQQRALYGEAGVDPNAGSPLDVMGDSAEQAKFEALSRRYTGVAEGTQAGQQASYDTSAAVAAKQAADTAAEGDIIGGVGKALTGLIAVL